MTSTTDTASTTTPETMGEFWSVQADMARLGECERRARFLRAHAAGCWASAHSPCQSAAQAAWTSGIAARAEAEADGLDAEAALLRAGRP